MNQLGNSSNKQRRSAYWKAHRIAITAATFAGLIFIAALVFVLNGSNNTKNNPTNSGQTSQTPPAPTSPPAPSPEAPTATGTVITTGNSEFGTMLFNENQQAIYIWEVEESEKPECYGDCAEAWPPVLTSGKPQAAGGAQEGLLGTAERTDGTTQVTYNGHPLYYYAHEGPGDVKCHNISTHGGLWWVVQPSGDRAD